MSKLYASATGISNPIDITVSDSHDSTTSTAVIKCTSHSLNIGDQIDVILGYTGGDSSRVFRGYVKQLEQVVPENIYTVTAHNVLIRAVDYFIASTNPDNPITYNNIPAETLIGNLMALAQLTSYNHGTTYFYLGIINPVEVNLVSAYDFSRMISDLVAWNIWADRNGAVNFYNRKPYPMDGTSGQPGDVADTPLKTITDSSILDFTPALDERELRNRVVVYGSSGIFAQAQSATSYNPRTATYQQILPAGFYKTAVAASQYIDSQATASNAASYNLALYNRLSDQGTLSVVGDHTLDTRKVITVNSSRASINGDYYIFFIEHSWSSKGYTTTMQLRR
jgi:hypothetical protein